MLFLSLNTERERSHRGHNAKGKGHPRDEEPAQEPRLLQRDNILNEGQGESQRPAGERQQALVKFIGTRLLICPRLTRMFVICLLLG